MEHSGSGGLKPRLLIVDDIEENREILRRRFGMRGYRSVEADGGTAALKLLEEQAFDLVLLDIQMPDLDGIETLRRIRETRSQTDLPVIMVTAQAQQSDVTSALEAGANDYVTKPVDFEKALVRVQAQIAKRVEALAQDPSTPVFYAFPERQHSMPPYPEMGVAAEALVLAHLTVEQIVEKLGGCCRYVDDGGGAYLGVWGEKNVERLHTLLQARAPKLLVKRDRPAWSKLEWRKAPKGAAA